MLGTKLIKAAAGSGAAEATDADFENTVLLLHGDGNQGATNFSNTGPTKYMAFTDNSTNNFPITVNGDAYGDNFSPFSVPEGYWSNKFDGSGDYLNKTSGALSLSGDFTIEYWMYPTNTGSYPTTLSTYNAVALQNSLYFQFGLNTTTFEFGVGNGSSGGLAGSYTATLNTWQHHAVVRSGSTVTVYVNGVSIGTRTSSVAFDLTSLGIGAYTGGSAGSYPFFGYISNFRVLNGTALYTSGFTPSTTPLTAITNTSLLTCQSNRFVDNSSNAFAITRNGDVAVTPFTPFTVTPNTTDGSGYFDGSGDYLELSSGAAVSGTQAYTVECFVYLPSSFTGYRTIIGGGSSGSLLLSFNGLTELVLNPFGTGGIPVSFTFTTSQWYHIAVCQSSGTTSIYINGTRVYNSAYNPSFTANAVTIGNAGAGNQQYAGFISNVRIVKGSAVYSGATITVPTTALTAVSGTSLLTCQYQGSVRNVGFIDSSPYDHRITRVGNTTQGSFSPFSKPDGAWGTYYDGTGDYLNVGTITALGSGDFTISAWVYPQKISAGVFHVGGLPSSVSGVAVFLSGTAAEGWGLYAKNTQAVSNTGAITLNKWYYITVIRSGTTTTLYVDGVSAVVISSDSTNYTQTSLAIGGFYSTSFLMLGYISNFRIVSSALTATVPTTPFTAVSGTTLLTCQSNRFVDNSTNNFTLTRNGDVKVTPFSPFPITTAYDPAVNGGSGYFDGAGDYLGLSTQNVFPTGTQNFTVEFWLYKNNAWGAGNQFIFDSTATNGFQIWVNTGGGILRLGRSGVAAVLDYAYSNLKILEWTHFAYSRSGNSFALWVNGVRVATATDSNAFATNNGTQVIGAVSADGSNPWNGYMSGIRFVRNSVVYDPSSLTITVPTSPPTPIANTAFLCNFTNAGILDNTGFNNLETVGNAQIDTSVKKYGTGALKFDGSGDALIVYDPSFQNSPGSGDWTFECWVYFNALPANYTALYHLKNDVSTSTTVFIVEVTSTGKLNLSTGTALIVEGTSSLLTTGSWIHIAVTRASGTFRTFINGTQDKSVANTTTYNGTYDLFGVWRYSGSDNYLNGYIDDLRITKGIARYTSNFTPPDKELPNIGE